MTQTLIPQSGLLTNYDETSRILDATTPEFLKPLRQLGAEEFAKVGLPNHKDEEFKYLSFREVEKINFQSSYGATVSRFDITDRTLAGKLDAITLTFVNGQHSPELSHDHVLPEGLWIGTLEDAILEREAEVHQYFSKIATLEGRLGSSNDERFKWLNQAFLDAAMVVIVKSNEKIAKPIHLNFIHLANHGPCAIYPRVLVILEDSAAAQIIESYNGLEGQYFINGLTEVFQESNSEFEHIRIQNETRDSFHIGTLAIEMKTGSRYHGTNLHFGAQLARLDLNAFLNGENIEALFNGVAIGSGDQVVDNHTRIDHAKPNCNSFEIYKTVLDDHATGIFNGKIFVYEDAQKTDAKQTNKAVLLSKNATINTKPQLEIFADDVKCTHGATVGKLQEDALFYLRARGIAKEEAESLLVYAFAADVLNMIPNADLKEVLEAKLFECLTVSRRLKESQQTKGG